MVSSRVHISIVGMRKVYTNDQREWDSNLPVALLDLILGSVGLDVE